MTGPLDAFLATLDSDLLSRVRASLGAPADKTRAPDRPQAVPLASRAEAEAAIMPDTPEWLRELYTSPMADSTYRIAGVPTRLQKMPREYVFQAAGLTQKSDVPFDDPTPSEPGAQTALSLHPDPLMWSDNGWLFDLTAGPDHPEPRDTFLHEQGHRYSGLREDQAEAFRAAFDVLSKTWPDTTGRGAMVDSVEQRFPGSRAMVSELAAHPSGVFDQPPADKRKRAMMTLDDIFGSALQPVR